MKTNKITSPKELRAILLGTIESVLEGRINVSQANAVVGLSTELHKSIRQEWDMKCYAADKLWLENGEVKKLMELE